MRKLKTEVVKELAQAVELGFKADQSHSKAYLFTHVLHCFTTKMAVYYVEGSRTEKSIYSKQSGYFFLVLDSLSSPGSSQCSFLGGTFYPEPSASPSRF